MRKTLIAMCAGLLVVVSASGSYAGPGSSKPTNPRKYDQCVEKKCVPVKQKCLDKGTHPETCQNRFYTCGKEKCGKYWY
jgi:hypothetical protein